GMARSPGDHSGRHRYLPGDARLCTAGREGLIKDTIGAEDMSQLTITLIGGPTALIEVDGFRLLTDPTFDGPGEDQLPHVTLKKPSRPARTTQDVGPVDAVLLSHDQHSDNLDNSGKAFLAQAGRVLTTVAGAKRLGGRAEGLSPWNSTQLTRTNGGTITVT